MNISMRMIGLILFISIILLLGMFFWPIILNDVIKPISLVVWLLLRVFVLSIGQQYYWWAIIFVVIYYLFRILPLEQISAPPGNSIDSNATLKTIEYWRKLFTLTKGDVRDEVICRRELIQLLLSFYSTKQHTYANLEMYDALHQGEIPLPEHIRTFLFQDGSKEMRWSFKKLVKSIWNIPTKWIHRWTGQETTEYYRVIDEVLSFMETSLEMNIDDKKINPTRY